MKSWWPWQECRPTGWTCTGEIWTRHRSYPHLSVSEEPCGSLVLQYPTRLYLLSRCWCWHYIRRLRLLPLSTCVEFKEKTLSGQKNIESMHIIHLKHFSLYAYSCSFIAIYICKCLYHTKYFTYFTCCHISATCFKIHRPKWHPWTHFICSLVPSPLEVASQHKTDPASLRLR